MCGAPEAPAQGEPNQRGHVAGLTSTLLRAKVQQEGTPLNFMKFTEPSMSVA